MTTREWFRVQRGVLFATNQDLWAFHVTAAEWVIAGRHAGVRAAMADVLRGQRVIWHQPGSDEDEYLVRMADDIAAELTRRSSTGRMYTGSEVLAFNDADPDRGLMWRIHKLYWSLFPERLPQPDDDRAWVPGDLAFDRKSNRSHVWTGSGWHPKRG